MRSAIYIAFAFVIAPAFAQDGLIDQVKRLEDGPGWHDAELDPTLWLPYDADTPEESLYDRFKYMKLPGGTVLLSGIMSGCVTPSGNGKPIFFLPMGFRPKTRHFLLTAAAQGHVEGYAHVYIKNTGAIYFWRFFGSKKAPCSLQKHPRANWLSLSGLHFPAKREQTE